MKVGMYSNQSKNKASQLVQINLYKYDILSKGKFIQNLSDPKRYDLIKKKTKLIFG